METEADRRALLLGLDGKFYPTAAGPLLGIFDDAFLDGATETTVPMLECTTCEAELRGLNRKGATITIRGDEYRVRRHEPDGTGMSRLILDK